MQHLFEIENVNKFSALKTEDENKLVKTTDKEHQNFLEGIEKHKHLDQNREHLRLFQKYLHF